MTIRRYTSKDIGDILELARPASHFNEANARWLLNNNLNNSRFFCWVVTDPSDNPVAVMVATLIFAAFTDWPHAFVTAHYGGHKQELLNALEAWAIERKVPAFYYNPEEPLTAPVLVRRG